MKRKLSLGTHHFSIASIKALTEKLFSANVLSAQLLYLCVVADIVFIGLHILYEFIPVIDDPALKITLDRGYAEVFQYVKMFWIASILSVVAFRSRSLLYWVWVGFFSYLLLDDSLRIHENWSKADYFPSLFGIHPHASGELIISGSIGVIFLSLIAATYRSGDRLAKSVSQVLVMMLILLGILGVLIDAFNSMVEVGIFNPLLATLEDGGEMIVISFILAFVFCLPQRLQSARKRWGRTHDTERMKIISNRY